MNSEYLNRSMRIKSKNKSTNKITFIDYFVILEEILWTFMIFFLIFLGLFFYLSGQAFVIRDELVVLKNCQEKTFNWVREFGGIWRDDGNILGQEEEGVKKCIGEEISLSKIIEMERKFRNEPVNRTTTDNNTIDELISLNKKIIDLKSRIKELKDQKLNSKKSIKIYAPNHESINSAQEFSAILNVQSNQNTKSMKARSMYYLWIRDTLRKLVDEVVFKAKNSTLQQALFMKNHLKRKQTGKEGEEKQLKIQAKINLIQSLLARAIEEIK